MSVLKMTNLFLKINSFFFFFHFQVEFVWFCSEKTEKHIGWHWFEKKQKSVIISFQCL